LIDFVGWIFDEMLKYVLFTPFSVFKTTTTMSLVFKFGVISGGLVTVLAMIEGIKRTLSMQYTPISTIIRRYPIALAVTAFAPTLFYFAGMGVNELVSLIGLITGSTLHSSAIYSSTLHQFGASIYMAFLTFIFIAVLGYYLIRTFFFHANRWFGLLFNCVMTPFVMLAYTFRPYEQVASGWLRDTLYKYGIQVYQSLLLSLVAVILYAPNIFPFEGTIDGMNSGLVRLMLSIGGLHVMNYPPSWLQSIFPSSGGEKNMLKNIVRVAKMLATRSK
jgi:hypothetical protein